MGNQPLESQSQTLRTVHRSEASGSDLAAFPDGRLLTVLGYPNLPNDAGYATRALSPSAFSQTDGASKIFARERPLRLLEKSGHKLGTPS